MKSLYESILSKSGAGVKTRIDEWCDKHKVYNGEYLINNKNEIEPCGNYTLIIREAMLENGALPQYIKFKPVFGIHMEVSADVKEIKSWKGFPDEVSSLELSCYEIRNMAPLEIKIASSFWAHWMSWRYMAEKAKIDITVVSQTTPKINFGDLALSCYKVHCPKSTTVWAVMKRDEDAEKIVKKGRGKMPLNSRRNVTRLTLCTPVQPEVQTFLDDMFKDIEGLTQVEYNQASELHRVNGTWYRFTAAQP